VDAEIARLQQQRVALWEESDKAIAAVRRSMHELDMATIDYRAAEQRRKLVGEQVEQALQTV